MSSSNHRKHQVDYVHAKECDQSMTRDRRTTNKHRETSNRPMKTKQSVITSRPADNASRSPIVMKVDKPLSLSSDVPLCRRTYTTNHVGEHSGGGDNDGDNGDGGDGDDE